MSPLVMPNKRYNDIPVFVKVGLKSKGENMKRVLSFFAVIALSLMMSGIADAATINYNYTANGNQYTSPYDAITEDFEGQLAWTWTGNYEIVEGSSSGKYSAPADINGVKETTKYVTVPDPLDGDGTGSVRVANLGGTYTYFGLWWGSVDAYNTITFYKDGKITESFTGSAVLNPNPANGNQTSTSTNLYVNFMGLKAFDSFEMSSTQFAFEADNISVGNPVPVPAAVWLFGAGLLGLVGVRRKMRS